MQSSGPPTLQMGQHMMCEFSQSITLQMFLKAMAHKGFIAYSRDGLKTS